MKIVKDLGVWRAEVKARDKACTECGATSGLVAHHVLPKASRPDLKLDVDNGVTLCMECHIKHHKANPVKDRSPGKVSLRSKIKEQEQYITLLKKQIEALKPQEKKDKRSVSAIKIRNASLESRIENVLEINHALKKENADLEEQNRLLKMAMREYEIAYEELGIPV